MLLSGSLHDVALRTLCLCDGYGGFELGLRLAGLDIRTVGRCERDSYAAAVLVARMEEQILDRAPLWDDIETFDGAAWRGCVDIITAGFPCQPFSTAGARRGVEDDRWLWPSIARIIGDVGPGFIFLENVPGLVRYGLSYVLSDLADLGFDAEWGMYSAQDVGAPHHRERFWLVAVAHSDWERLLTGSAEQEGHELHVVRPGLPGLRTFPPRPDDSAEWKVWIEDGGPEPSVHRVADGRPDGLVDALHLGGNGLVPLVASHAFQQLVQRGSRTP